VARLGRVHDGRGGGGPAHARRHEPLEREQGHVVGAAAHRTCRGGALRRAHERVAPAELREMFAS
jgi:hypothetical protein